jgi:hypothetical protein
MITTRATAKVRRIVALECLVMLDLHIVRPTWSQVSTFGGTFLPEAMPGGAESP